MRIIPKKTKVSTEFFKGLSLADMLVGFLGILIMFFVLISSLPAKLWIEVALLFIFGLLLVRIDDEPNYMFLLQVLNHFAHERRYQKLETPPPAPAKTDKKKEKAPKKAKTEQKSKPLNDDMAEKPMSRKEEDRLLKAKDTPQAVKDEILQRRKEASEAAYYASKIAEQKANRKDITAMSLVSAIKDGYIHYSGQYYGAAIEIPSVEFRFFSQFRRTNAIDRSLGSIIRTVGAKYAANIVKIERPLILDDYIQGEYDKIEALKNSYQRGVFSEEELKARVEIIYDRINHLMELNDQEKVLVPHFYLVLFDSNKRQLDNQINSALSTLQQGEMNAKRLSDKELAVFLRYTNSVDFDEREIDQLSPEDYVKFTQPQSLELKLRSAEVNSIVTHNFRVINYPLEVSDAWGAGLFDIPGTKAIMKFTQMDREKSIRAIDRSISELHSQRDKTSISSRIIELETHIETLSNLLVMLQNNNESLMAMNLYITGYDIAQTRDDKLLVPQPPPSALPLIPGLKKDIKRAYTEAGFKLTDMICQQFEGYVATQVNAYDPFAKKARGVPSSTVAGVFPWIFASLRDQRGLNLGSADGVPTFVNFFRRDHERVNSNMVIVGKSGGGKSYATKSILTNLAADDSKIFVLDPENEYTELASNLHGKFINTANATHGRINPFHIITSLEDDEATDGEETSSFAAHLQFLEEFFRQILPEIDSDAMEYLNNLIIRVYSQRGIDQFTNLNNLAPEDYPIFDDLYDCILEEFQRTKSDYLKSNLRVLMNYIAKFSTGGRNSGIWNGPSSLSTVENFIVFNFQTLLANRNNTVANAQMLLVLKYLDNEIIKNREYNLRYGASRKIIIVIDEAHVFIDAKYPLALDFMFQLAKRIRKYNGMQIVITQNIKDFVGSEELSRKSTAIINACQYSLIFSLAPNDMHDLCTLYEKAGGINESEQEQIVSAPRGQAFVVTSPSSRASLRIETPKPVEEMFSRLNYRTHYFAGEDGEAVWEEAVADSRQARQEWEESQAQTDHKELLIEEDLPNFRDVGIDLVELEEEEEILLMDDGPAVADSLPKHMQMQGGMFLEEDSAPAGGAFSPEALQRYGFEALVSEIRKTVKAEVESELGIQRTAPKAEPMAEPAEPAMPTLEEFQDILVSEPAPAAEMPPVVEDWFTAADPVPPPAEETAAPVEDWYSADTFTVNDWFQSDTPANPLEGLITDVPEEAPVVTELPWEALSPQVEELSLEALSEAPAPAETAPADTRLVYEITLEELIAMKD